MKPEPPLVTMRDDERICFDRAMEQWLKSTKRPDLSEKDRVKGALLAYQRQAFVFHDHALLDAHQRGRQEGMEEAAELLRDHATISNGEALDPAVPEILTFISAKAQEAAKEGG